MTLLAIAVLVFDYVVLPLVGYVWYNTFKKYKHKDDQ
jgi:hypothetical protein